MKHLVESFQSHLGTRGVHFYNEENCNFLSWLEVFEFIRSIPQGQDNVDSFSERLTDTLANYDPDKEFLAVCQNGTSISVELYARVDQTSG